MVSKKAFGRRVFISASIRQHFKAIGWSEPKIVMRFWVVAVVTALLGAIPFLIGTALV
jgi:phospho-N-acetylmuramoyl-pentapeptide-transferase